MRVISNLLSDVLYRFAESHVLAQTTWWGPDLLRDLFLLCRPWTFRVSTLPTPLRKVRSVRKTFRFSNLIELPSARFYMLLGTACRAPPLPRGPPHIVLGGSACYSKPCRSGGHSFARQASTLRGLPHPLPPHSGELLPPPSRGAWGRGAAQNEAGGVWGRRPPRVDALGQARW
jgi:hypothetical protein